MDFDRLSERPEARAVAFTDVDLSKDGTMFRGYASVFDEAADLGRFTESVARGAFRKALAAGTNVPMYWNHNAELPPLATTQGGTLRLKEDGKGLFVEADIARHFVGEALREMVDRGDVRGMSYGFVAGVGNSRIEGGAKPHRTLTGFRKLLDVSPTHDPAYAGTTAELRSLVMALQIAGSLDDEQQLLLGAYHQPEDRAAVQTVDTDTDPAPVETETAEPAATVEDDQQDEDTQDSGADEAIEAAAAARRRRLHMLGLTLPPDARAA